MTIQERAERIRLVVMDVDGTLTDNSMYYTADGEMMKRFSTRDGMGVTLLHRSGVRTAILTSEHSEIAAQRAKKLKIEHVILGSHDKSTSIMQLAEQLGIPMEAIAYIGDDVNDGPVMRLCGLAACPSDAVESIIKSAHFVCSYPGGNGAVRELAEVVLRSQGLPVTLPENW